MRRGPGRTRCSIVAANKEVNEASRGESLQYCSRCINEVTLNREFMIASEIPHQPGVRTRCIIIFSGGFAGRFWNMHSTYGVWVGSFRRSRSALVVLRAGHEGRLSLSNFDTIKNAMRGLRG